MLIHALRQTMKYKYTGLHLKNLLPRGSHWCSVQFLAASKPLGPRLRRLPVSAHRRNRAHALQSHLACKANSVPTP